MSPAFFIGILVFLFCLFVLVFMPTKTHAQTNTAAATDASCRVACAAAQAQNPPKPCPSPTLILCGVNVGGAVTGICQLTGCQAITAAGLNGGNAMSSMGDLAKTIGQILGQLMSGSGSGSDSGSSDTPAATCPNGYYQSSVQTSDPCAYYVPSTVPTSTVDTSGQDLLNELGQTGSNTIDTSGVNLNANLTTTANVTGTFQAPNSQTGTTTPGLSGGIQTSGTGATFVANNVQSNTETSAFFGGDTLGGFVKNLIGGWCEARPWAGGIIASIIPPSFFDGLCTHGGFTVGTPAPVVAASNQTSATLTQTPVQHTTPTQQTALPTTQLIPARVDIWAVPSAVPLGARTTIFWNTENVTNCTETSPDGSFNQNSLSGGAATVPITQATTFTISCLDSQQNPATDYVTVSISG